MDNINYVLLLFIILIVIIFTIRYYYKTIKIEYKYFNKLNKLIDTKLSNTDKKLFIIPYIELGDNIIINGAIQYLAKKYDTIIYGCKKSNYKQISYMFKNLDNIIYYIIPDKYTLPYIKYYIPINDKIHNKFIKYNISYINFITYDISKYIYGYINNDFVKKTYLILFCMAKR